MQVRPSEFTLPAASNIFTGACWFLLEKILNNQLPPFGSPKVPDRNMADQAMSTVKMNIISKEKAEMNPKPTREIPKSSDLSSSYPVKPA